MKQTLIVFLGGGLGSVARFALNLLISQKQLHVLWSTFTVNIIGSLLIGVVLGWSFKSTVVSQQTTLFLATGFCGGFTTFSTFAYENQQLLKNGDMLLFFLYTLGSLFIGLCAVFIGLWVSKL